MYEGFTPEFLKAKMLQVLSDEITKIEGSFSSDVISASAYRLHLIYQELDALINTMFIRGLKGILLDARCSEYGLYRLAGTKAKGSLTLIGSAGAKLPSGAMFVTDSGLEFVYTGNEIVYSSTGFKLIELEAAAAGSKYNAVNETIRTAISYSGITPVRSSFNATGGTDPECDDDLKKRLLLRLRNPTGSGCINDYVMWALAVAGVGKVQVIPRWDGAGTVKVLIADDDLQPASSEVLQRVEDAIEAKRPIGAVVTVESFTAVPITITATAALTKPKAEVEAAFTAAVKEYLKTATGTVQISKLGCLLLNIDGVTDYSELKINDSTDNLTFSETELPVIDEVVINEVV